ncbi:MAG: FYDLN acid domain-containing protein [Myxococcota bacterium]|jgi:hypothetical protein|nr:FYDLN acid domain-containing protein [Myxococcota bacterium]
MQDKSTLGTRYTCSECGAKFYDLNRPKAICPSCQTNQGGDDEQSEEENELQAAVEAEIEAELKAEVKGKGKAAKSAKPSKKEKA